MNQAERERIKRAKAKALGTCVVCGEPCLPYTRC